MLSRIFELSFWVHFWVHFRKITPLDDANSFLFTAYSVSPEKVDPIRAPDHPPQTSEESEVFLLSEDILKAGNYDHPLQKYRKRKYIKPLYSLSTHAQSSMNLRHCEM